MWQNLHAAFKILEVQDILKKSWNKWLLKGIGIIQKYFQFNWKYPINNTKDFEGLCYI